MAALPHVQIVAQLEAHGLRTRTFALETEGEYQPADVDWNNKDIPHLSRIHAWKDDVTFRVEQDMQASISLQKVLGMTCPVVFVHYDTGPEPRRQAHVFSLGPWTVVSDIQIEAASPTRTRTTTQYTIAANRAWILAAPVIRALLRRNHNQLLSEDLPLRERRARLRAWGHRFVGDEDESRSFLDTTLTSRDNVQPPPVEIDADPRTISVPLRELEHGRRLIGRSDHLGLQLSREGDRVMVFPRMCPHEGAELDDAAEAGGVLLCPWHGRQLPPVAVVSLTDGQEVTDGGGHRFRVEGGQLVIERVSSGSGAAAPCRSAG